MRCPVPLTLLTVLSGAESGVLLPRNSMNIRSENNSRNLFNLGGRSAECDSLAAWMQLLSLRGIGRAF